MTPSPVLAEADRLRRFVDVAATAMGRAPEFVVRAPGRVNLIGEHTDYNGLPVMPMAIDRSVMIAGRRRGDAVITMRNAAAVFPPREFALAETIEPFPAGDWGNYPKAAAQGLRRHLGAGFARGADLYIDGNVPEGAGLSSSAAMVVASALALLTANDRELPLAELAQLLPRAEQYVGTLSGGMDQTISLLGQAGHALRIDFEPLRYRPVPLPHGYVFAVAHSLVHADKAGSARRAYNTRVAECRLAAWLLSRVLRPRIDLDGQQPATLGAIVSARPDLSARELLTALADEIPSGPIDLAAIAAAAGGDAAALRSKVALPADVGETFTLVERTRHVLTEAERVEAAEAALRAGDIPRFARLLQASHASCRDDYGISCPALEQLVQAAEASGALAARLTGAGFGGCIVALLPEASASAFLAGLDERFYAPRGVDAGERGKLRFLLRPAAGAEVHRLEP